MGPAPTANLLRSVPSVNDLGDIGANSTPARSMYTTPADGFDRCKVNFVGLLTSKLLTSAMSVVWSPWVLLDARLRWNVALTAAESSTVPSLNLRFGRRLTSTVDGFTTFA